MARNASALLVAVLIACTVGSASARDLPNLSGAWSGTISIPEKGKLEKSPLHATLKHSGSALSGTVGSSIKSQIDITKGEVESTQFGTSITFDLPGTGSVMHFELRLANNVLRGFARLDGEKAKAPVELQFVK